MFVTPKGFTDRGMCYLDLDGVIVDFVGGALAWHGREDLLEGPIGLDLPEQLGMSRGAFWESLGFDFWVGRKKTPEADAILKLVESHFGDRVAVLTSPCLTRGSVEGKTEWIRRNLPRYVCRFFVGPTKELLAGPNRVLIDDHDSNCQRFAEAGGKAILVPRPWNEGRHLCRNAEEVVRGVERGLRSLECHARAMQAALVRG